jgi:hypothetical protein
VLVVEEIASETAWRELLDRLREHEGVLSSHIYSATSYQKLGVIHRASMVTPGAPTLLFPDAPASPPNSPRRASSSRASTRRTALISRT